MKREVCFIFLWIIHLTGGEVLLLKSGGFAYCVATGISADQGLAWSSSSQEDCSSNSCRKSSSWWINKSSSRLGDVINCLTNQKTRNCSFLTRNQDWKISSTCSIGPDVNSSKINTEQCIIPLHKNATLNLPFKSPPQNLCIALRYKSKSPFKFILNYPYNKVLEYSLPESPAWKTNRLNFSLPTNNNYMLQITSDEKMAVQYIRVCHPKDIFVMKTAWEKDIGCMSLEAPSNIMQDNGKLSNVTLYDCSRGFVGEGCWVRCSEVIQGSQDCKGVTVCNQHLCSCLPGFYGPNCDTILKQNDDHVIIYIIIFLSLFLLGLLSLLFYVCYRYTHPPDSSPLLPRKSTSTTGNSKKFTTRFDFRKSSTFTPPPPPPPLPPVEKRPTKLQQFLSKRPLSSKSKRVGKKVQEEPKLDSVQEDMFEDVPDFEFVAPKNESSKHAAKKHKEKKRQQQQQERGRELPIDYRKNKGEPKLFQILRQLESVEKVSEDKYKLQDDKKKKNSK